MAAHDRDRDRVLDRLGLAAVPDVGAAGLTALYRAWCRHVPFDNVRKRIALEADRNGPLPGLVPTDFFEAFLAHGTGATCWPNANALHWRLAVCGFDASRVTATMEPVPIAPDDPVRPNHGSNVVDLDETLWLLDSSMLTEAPVPLVRGADSAMADPVVGCELTADAGRWRGRFMPWRPEGMLTCAIESLEADEALFAARYEYSRTSGRFNEQLHVRRNFANRVEILALGQHFVIARPTGEITTATVVESRPERDRLLVETFGFSEQIVAQLPPDRLPAGGQ